MTELKYDSQNITYLNIELNSNIRNLLESTIDADITHISQDNLEKALDELDEQKKNILIQIFGLNGEQKTLDNISQNLNISRQRVQQIENVAFDELVRTSLRKEWEVKYNEYDPKLPIEISELSYRIRKVLRWGNIHTINELTKYKESDLLKMKNYGLKSLKETQQYLTKFGLSLSE